VKWSEIRAHYPQQWLLAEAITAHSQAGKRIVDELAVIEILPDSVTAMSHYALLHRAMPERELYVLHTSREHLDITERTWLGIRAGR
jgi:hypothetical protein